MTHPVQNISLRTPLLPLEVSEAELQAHTAVPPHSVLRGAEDGEGAGEGDGGEDLLL